MQTDIIRFTDDVTDLKLNGGKITGVKSQKIQKASARIFKNGQIFSSAIVGNVSDGQLFETADQKGNVGITYDYSLPNTPSTKSVEPMPESREIGIQKYRAFLTHLLEKYPRLIWRGSAKFYKIETQFSSTYWRAL